VTQASQAAEVGQAAQPAQLGSATRAIPDAQAASQAFPRSRRILKTDEFSSVFRLRPAYRTAHFVLYTRTSPSPQPRLGIVAAKRLAPRAVTRNTIKRVARELFRKGDLPAIDCIVRLAKPVNQRKGPARTTQLKALLHEELGRLLDSQRTRPQSSAPGEAP
jgi:ribonuclease P protein component